MATLCSAESGAEMIIRAMAIPIGICLSATTIAAMESSQGRLSVTTMATGLDEPWGLGFLTGGGFLVTERAGRLWLFKNGERREVRGVPKVVGLGQGGLLDIMIPRDFERTRQIYLTFSKAQGRGEGTALGRATLATDGARLLNFQTLFEMTRGSRGGRHFGSRVIEAPDGTLFMTIGERGDRPSAQDLSRHNGSVLHLTRDGRAAPGNPFTDQNGAMPEIWSYGHRNAQGMALDPDGNLWVVEHGARGGDEVNRIRRGANYGWPVIAYGRHYTGLRIGEGTHRDGMEQPDFYWDPSIAPSGMMIYSGKLWPDWRGDIFVGSLKFDYISRLNGTGTMREVEQLKSPETGRVRDIREAPDGSIWFLSVIDGAVYRIAP